MKWLSVLLLIGAVLVASENPDENAGIDDPDLFEGDMILTPDQMMAAKMGMDVDNPFGRGSTMNRQWPGGVVPYVIDPTLSGDSRAMKAIDAGMREWITKTCITFKKRTTEQGYVNFKLGSGCSSYVGRTGRKQDINLARGCWYTGIVAHEIGHALGFYHEQSRPDRDNYVTIMWDNIIERNKFNFNKYSKSTIDSLGTPYDYGSVMHYGGRSFSMNGQPTIVPKKAGVSIGQRRGISDTDAKQMNLLYKDCSGPTTQPPTTPGSCVDKNKNCPGWTKYCSYHSYVIANCKRTCNLC